MRHTKLVKKTESLTKEELTQLQSFYSKGIKKGVNKFTAELLLYGDIQIATIKSGLATGKLNKKVKDKIFNYIQKQNVYSISKLKKDMNTSERVI